MICHIQPSPFIVCISSFKLFLEDVFNFGKIFISLVPWMTVWKRVSPTPTHHWPGTEMEYYKKKINKKKITVSNLRISKSTSWTLETHFTHPAWFFGRGGGEMGERKLLRLWVMGTEYPALSTDDQAGQRPEPLTSSKVLSAAPSFTGLHLYFIHGKSKAQDRYGWQVWEGSGPLRLRY